jgi:hypothetical protein
MTSHDDTNRPDRGTAPRRAALPDDETPEYQTSDNRPSNRPDSSDAGRSASRAAGRHRGAPGRAADDPHRPPSHKALLIGTIAAVIVLIIVGVSSYFINSSQPVAPSATPVATSTWALDLPVQIGNYTRDPNTTSAPTAQGGVTTTSATYAAKGKNAVVVLMSRPQTDLKKFMSDAGMTAVGEQPLSDRSGSALCGVDPDHNDTGCVVLQENTAVLALGLQDQSRQDLADLAQQAAKLAAGQK